MRVFATSVLLCGLPLLAPCVDAAEGEAGSSTVIGPANPLLADGAAAMQDGRFEDGIRLTLEGLRGPADPDDRAAGHSNLCAGYATLRRWDEALAHCEQALQLDPDNWRTYNNRAAVFVAKGLYDRALEDLRRGLDLAPQSDTLQKSLQIVLEHKKAHESRRRSAVRA
jgi:tetratricopeptide (TPR) repeat protein